MKTELRQVLPLLLILTTALAACGKQKVASGTYEKPSAECEGDVAPNRYIIRYLDGSMKVVTAATTEKFFSQFVDPDLDQIAFTEPDYVVRNNLSAQDLPDPVSTSDNWGSARVGADAMWAANVRGAGVNVAVIDSGMDITHPQLRTQVMVNAGEQGVDSLGRNKESNGVDDDGNGYADDVNGWDFVSGRPLQGDNQYHGTHVSGIIGAVHTDTTAGSANHVQGMAPAAKILPVAFLNDEGSGMMSDGVRAIQYAVSRGVRVINASWGGPMCSKSLRDEIARLEAANVMIVVAAAGNGYKGEGYDIDLYRDYPASLNSATQFTVAATSSIDLRIRFSNYGDTNTHIFAPGVDIVSTMPTHLISTGMSALSGTSMAAPLVTGAIALLLSAEPTATVAQVRMALYNVSHKDWNLRCASHGRMDLRGAKAELHRLIGP